MIFTDIFLKESINVIKSYLVTSKGTGKIILLPLDNSKLVVIPPVSSLNAKLSQAKLTVCDPSNYSFSD